MPSRFRTLEPSFAPWAQYLFDVAVASGFRPTVTSTFRSVQRQAVLYERWKRGLSPLPAAPPGRSWHNYGLAFDLVVSQGWQSEEQKALGRFWQSLGGRWYPKDPVHFEARTS